jgi:hypothetical protein
MLVNIPFEVLGPDGRPDDEAKLLCCSLLQDSFGSIKNISQANVQDLLDRTPISRASAEELVAFFDQQMPTK